MLWRLWLRYWSLVGRVSILVKIMGIVLLVVLALGLAFAWFVTSNVASSLERELEMRGIAIGNGLATDAANLILTEDVFEVYRRAQNALKANDAVRYIYIEDPQGQVLVHTFDAGFPMELLWVSRSQKDAPQTVTLETREGRFLDVSVPILQGDVGKVHVGLSTASIDAAMGEHIRFTLIAIPLVLVPGLLLAYLLALIITRALSSVVRAAEAVGRGDFTQRAPIWAEDEIGRLGVAFNQMTERLMVSHGQLLHRYRELSILNATARAASSSLALEDVLQGALEKLCRLMEMGKGRICLFDSNRGLVSFSYQQGPQPSLVRAAFPQELAFCPYVEALATSPYMEGSFPHDCPIRDEKVLEPFPEGQATICLPLRIRGRLLGIMHLSRERNLPFSPEDIQLLTGVAEQLAVAVENARLWEDLKQREEMKSHLLERVIAAQEEERRRVAQELHDEAGQALTSLLVELRALEFIKEREALLDKVAQLRALVADSLSSLQSIALALRPSMLDDVGLVPALRRYIQDYATRHSLEVDFQTSGMENLRLQPPVETAVYRVIQEALTNVARHAEARSVSVVLTRRNEDLVAIVEDDGKGFPVGEVLGHPQVSLGLRGMMERASLVGGHLTIESKPGGTTVFLETPLAGNVVAEGSRG